MHITHTKSFYVSVSIALATLANMINVFEICLYTTNYLIFNMQDFRYCMWTSILECFGQLVSPPWKVPFWVLESWTHLKLWIALIGIRYLNNSLLERRKCDNPKWTEFWKPHHWCEQNSQTTTIDVDRILKTPPLMWTEFSNLHHWCGHNFENLNIKLDRILKTPPLMWTEFGKTLHLMWTKFKSHYAYYNI